MLIAPHPVVRHYWKGFGPILLTLEPNLQAKIQVKDTGFTWFICETVFWFRLGQKLDLTSFHMCFTCPILNLSLTSHTSQLRFWGSHQRAPCTSTAPCNLSDITAQHNDKSHLWAQKNIHLRAILKYTQPAKQLWDESKGNTILSHGYPAN